MGRPFEEIELGRTETTKGRTVSESDVYRYAGLEGHYGEIHCNQEYAKSTQYGGRIAHGGLSIVLINGFMTQITWNHDVISLYGLDCVRFVNPIYINDTVHLEATIKNKERREDDLAVVTYHCDLQNQEDETMSSLEWMYLIDR